MKTLLTFPGKTGDFFHQFRAAAEFIRRGDGEVHLWLDRGSLGRVVPLLERDYFPVAQVTWELRPGIQDYLLGGRPYDFGAGETVPGFSRIIHLGFREHPRVPITLESANRLKLTSAEITRLARNQTLWPVPLRVPGRLLFHSPLLCHTGPVQKAWEVLVALRDRFLLESFFSEVLVVGTAEEVTYAQELGFKAEEADWVQTARLLAGADILLSGGSGVAALAALVACPCCRIGQAFEVDFPFPRAFTNLAPCQGSFVPDLPELPGRALDFLISNRR